ncbi:hypothetical protein B0H16DRAFT_1476858 [Mycena metata]|uniref:Uncharacterized protein n=1 Tax=Mycena metata TaxID=1033252 RepID=A0AAD7HAW5_9AGAR|nr:hypothetical protein B0H16DRAFT_1476858 [Mycena metata]
MIDITYLILGLCLVVTNLTRLVRAFKWFLSFLSRPRNPRLVPYFDRQAPNEIDCAALTTKPKIELSAKKHQRAIGEGPAISLLEQSNVSKTKSGFDQLPLMRNMRVPQPKVRPNS